MAKKGHIVTPEHRAKISKALTGRPRTQFVRDLIAQGVREKRYGNFSGNSK